MIKLILYVAAFLVFLIAINRSWYKHPALGTWVAIAAWLTWGLVTFALSFNE